MRNRQYIIYLVKKGTKEELDSAQNKEEAALLKQRYSDILGKNNRIVIESYQERRINDFR